jgi:hypothetical protein
MDSTLEQPSKAPAHKGLGAGPIIVGYPHWGGPMTSEFVLWLSQAEA